MDLITILFLSLAFIEAVCLIYVLIKKVYVVHHGTINGHPYFFRGWKYKDISESLAELYSSGVTDGLNAALTELNSVDLKPYLEKIWNKGRDQGFEEAIDSVNQFWGGNQKDNN